MRLLVFLLLSFNWFSYAGTGDTCKAVFNLPEFLITPRDQADLSWCYAYTAADLVSAYAGQEVSAADIAISFNHSKVNQSYRVGLDKKEPKRKGFHEQGEESNALFISLDEGFCSEKDFPSSVMTKTIDNPQLKMNEIRKVPLSDRLYRALQLGRLDYTPKDCLTTGASDAFPNITPTDLAEILAMASGMEGDKNRSVRSAYLAKVNCENKRIPAPFARSDIKIEDVKLEAMNKILADGKIATIALPFVPYIRKPSAGNIDSIVEREKLEKSEGSHSMLLVGRRRNEKTGVCEYIFKNSWGNTTDKTQKTVDGYTFIAGDDLAKVIDGSLMSVNKPPTWKPAKIPKSLQPQ